jgi:uncharacterized membrane protein
MNAAQQQAVEILSKNSTQVLGKNSVSAKLTKIPGAGYYDWDHIAVDGDTFYLAQTAADEHTNGVFYGGSALLNSKTGTLTPEISAAIDATLNPIVVPVVAPAVVMKKCSCGHTIPAHMAMSASMGSSCPDCYDRMSE